MAFYTEWFANNPQNAAESCKWLGTYMQLRYQRADLVPPVVDWPMPVGEKDFFICSWMNQVIESDGFGTLGEQHPKDVEAFVHILEKAGANETSRLVRDGISELKRSALREDNYSPDYFDLLKRDNMWLKLVKLSGQEWFVRYSERAVELERRGKNLFNPKEWQKPWKD